MRRFLLLGLAGFLLSGSALMSAGAQVSNDAGLDAKFDAAINPHELDGWLKILASQPNQVGSPHDKINADWILAQFKSFGWDAHIEQYDVLYPTPISEALDMPNYQGKKWSATLQERPLPGDTSSTAKDYALPAYLAFQGDGDVTAPLVYVNYGNIEDYKRLEQFGISVKGKIVISRYGEGWRGLKVKLAQDHGAVGALIYSDPADDGYSVDSTYPNGAMRPPQGIQRGSVADMTIYPGDPLTPGIAAKPGAKRLTRETSPSLMKIPALPISYADAQVMLGAMDGVVAPANWRGHLGITYRVTGSVPVHLAVKSEWGLKPIYDVVATLKGAQYPDQWVIRGNHHDGWVEGASDPLSGQVALLSEAKALGEMVKGGWKPKRTIVYTSWDAEEPMLLGSTEWAEDHGPELQKKAVLYINSDGNGRGILNVGGSEDLEKFVSDTLKGVVDPETKAMVEARSRARLRMAGPMGDDHAKAMAKQAADATKHMPLDPLGSGSDYSAYLQHLGLETLDYGYGGEGRSTGVYHSRYDTYEHHSRFVDPGFVYDAELAKTVGRVVIAAADTDLPIQQAGDFSDAIAQYVTEVKKLADNRREAAETQKKMLADNAYILADDPTKPHANPAKLAEVPKFDFGALDSAAAKLKTSAKAYDDAIAAGGAHLSAGDLAKLQGLMQSIDQTLLVDQGLPGRSWYKNLIYAPGRFTGYGAKTLPGVREAIEEERWADVTKYVALTANALNAYSARLDQATAVVKH
jgi:N-acetylated-alpha-linked acidic dipeptidase